LIFRENVSPLSLFSLLPDKPEKALHCYMVRSLNSSRPLHGCRSLSGHFLWSLQRLQNSKGSPPQHYMTAGASPDLRNHQYTAAGALSPTPFIAITSCRTIFCCKKDQTTLQESFAIEETEQTALQEQNRAGQHHLAVAANPFFSPEVTLHGCRSSSGKEFLYINQVNAHPGAGETAPAVAGTIIFKSKMGLHHCNGPVSSPGLHTRQVNASKVRGETGAAPAVMILQDKKTGTHHLHGQKLLSCVTHALPVRSENYSWSHHCGRIFSYTFSMEVLLCSVFSFYLPSPTLIFRSCLPFPSGSSKFSNGDLPELILS
jgi:hypothetical protein